MDFGKKNHEIDLFDFTSFLVWTFLNFLAHCDIMGWIYFMWSNFGSSSIAGHLGSVNDVDFHKVEPIILSASSDKQIYLGEFDDE